MEQNPANILVEAVALLGLAVQQTIKEVAPPGTDPTVLRQTLARNVDIVLDSTQAKPPLRSMMQQFLDTIDL